MAFKQSLLKLTPPAKTIVSLKVFFENLLRYCSALIGKQSKVNSAFIPIFFIPSKLIGSLIPTKSNDL